MSTDALPQQAQAAQVTAAGETTAEVTPQVAPVAVESGIESGGAPEQVAGPEQVKAPEPEEAPEREDNLETRTAARLHDLVVSGAEKLPGETGSTVSKIAVALLSFGSQAAAKEQDKPTTKLVGEAVQLYKSLDDDDPTKQRAVLEHALETFTTSTIGGKERSQVLEVAEEAMNLWGKLRGTSSDLAKSDAAASMRSLDQRAAQGGPRRGGGRDGDRGQAPRVLTRHTSV